VAVALVAASCSDPASSTEPAGTAAAAPTTTATTASSAPQGTATTAAPTTAAPTTTPYASAVYADPTHWVCRPDLTDPCDGDLAATAVAGDGTLTVEPYEVAVDPPVDCFYAYPTSSEDATTNSDLVVGREAAVARVQVGAFSQVCALYAPLYRSVTLAGLFGTASSGTDLSTAWSTAYADVADAWHHYLANDNQGRPVVLIGHSQGTSHLIRLIRDEIDPDPEARARLVSAVLLGGAVGVPSGERVGGVFGAVPLCASADETGCVVTYASYPATTPPGDGALFGRPNRLFAGPADTVAGCTNPAELLGEATLQDRFPTADWALTDGRGADAITTPFMSFPGLISARCVERDGRGWLEVTVDADPADPRADDLQGRLSPEWGWHAIDMELAQASLVEIVRRQAAAITSGS
jgi:hypothetical protein